MLCKIWFFSFEVSKMFIFVPKLVSGHNKRQIRKVLVHYFHQNFGINSMLEIFLIQTQMIRIEKKKKLYLHAIHQLYVFNITRIGICMKV